MSTTHRATLIGSVSIILWGALALFTRLTGDKIPPFQLMAMTFAIAFLLMAIQWWRQGHSGLQHINQPALSWVIGIGGLFGYHFCYFSAMSKAPAIEVSLLAYLWPLLIVLFSTLLPNTTLKPHHIVGAVIAFVGCWVLVSQGGNGFSLEYTPGYLLALACAFIWSIYSVTSRLVKTVPTDAVGWFCALTALLALVCHLLLETTVMPNTAIQWMGIIGLGLGPVGIAFFTWDYGVKHGNIQLLGTLAYATPLISVLLLLAIGEGNLSIALVIACIAIVSGSLIAGLVGKKPGRNTETVEFNE